MKQIVIATALTAAAIVTFLAGCASDIILPPDPTLKGVYKGEYAFVRNFGAPNEQRFEQPVNWTFDDPKYFMTIDTASPNVGSHSFCKVSGNYVLTTGVKMQKISSVPMGGQFVACISDEDPDGTFTLIQRGDTLVMTLLDGSDLKELKLIKVQ
jgi:hypothetical protein